MKHLLIVAALALLSIGATFRLTCTSPAFENDGTCAEPALSPREPLSTMWLHFSWTGPRSGRDSLLVISGQSVNLTRIGYPPGLYTVTAWAADSGGVGCDTTITLRLRGTPWKPTWR